MYIYIYIGITLTSTNLAPCFPLRSFKGPLALLKGMLFSFAQVRGSSATSNKMHRGSQKRKVIVKSKAKVNCIKYVLTENRLK